MDKSKFQASYSVLSLWARGEWEEAVRAYFHLQRVVTPQMAEGRDYHEQWNQHICETRRLPDIFGGVPLREPVTELKLTVNLYPWLDLVGVIDCYDRPTIYEFKTGNRSAAKYANDFQVAVYGVLATLSDLHVERAEIHRYNQYAHKADMSIVWLTDRLLRDGINWIETFASEMYQYLLENQLYERFAA
ncbi:MAG: hypothetical protein GX552_19030 [Chloroflexi bacterium]|jgi:hypothetical protein|nr:hypothetical protein [Chloroflexota bacterium]